MFVAVPIPTPIVDQVSELIAGLKKGCKFINFPMTWTQPNSLHITLKFLGDIRQSQVEEISRELNRITNHHAPLRLKIHEMGVIPNWKRPRVLWLGVGSNGTTLQDLQAEVWQQLDRYCEKREKNEFHPHLTIGRFKSFAGIDTAKNVIISHRGFKTEHFEVGRIVLYRSVLLPSGAVHHPVEEFGMDVSANPTKTPENIA